MKSNRRWILLAGTKREELINGNYTSQLITNVKPCPVVDVHIVKIMLNQNVQGSGLLPVHEKRYFS